jgi:DNA-directed RNA polymerase specialized sigma24 family protein
MDRDAAMFKLPHIYATALRLRDAGLDEAEIAARLEMTRPAVGRLLHAAETKLAELLRTTPAQGGAM